MAARIKWKFLLWSGQSPGDFTHDPMFVTNGIIAKDGSSRQFIILTNPTRFKVLGIRQEIYK